MHIIDVAAQKIVDKWKKYTKKNNYILYKKNWMNETENNYKIKKKKTMYVIGYGKIYCDYKNDLELK